MSGGWAGSAMLIGEPSKMDEIFLPHSLRPSCLAEELRGDMELDVSASGAQQPPPPPPHRPDCLPLHRGASGGGDVRDPGTPAADQHQHQHQQQQDGGTKTPPPPPQRPDCLPLHRGAGGGGGGDDRDPAADQHQHQQDGGTTTRILVDALVTTPTATTRWYQASLTSVVLTAVVLLCLIFGHRYIRLMLLWLQEEDVSVGLLIFTLLFFVISFPLFWGYALLLLAAGYLYGCVCGPLVVVGCGGVALACANAVMRTCCRGYFMQRFYSAKVQAIIRFMNRGAAFKIVALTRLTPIPFGLQNALFSVSIFSSGYLSQRRFFGCFFGGFFACVGCVGVVEQLKLIIAPPHRLAWWHYPRRR